MKNFLKLVCFALLSLSLHAQTIINQEYVQQWQAQPASPGLPVFNNCYLYLDQTTHLLIGINSDGSYCLAPNGSGGGIAPGTPYQVTRYDANGTNIQDSTGSDNPANGPTRWVQGLSVENNAGYRAFTNSPNGTSLNQLVCLDPSVTTMAQVMTCAVSSTSVFGIADNGAGATGTVRVAMFGFHSCVFDNQTVIGDWVIPSTSVAGDCSDAGAAKPTGSQVLGHATSLNAGAGTLGTVDLFTGDTIAPGGGGNPVTVNPCIQVGCDAYYVMTNVIGGDPNTNDDGNGNKQSKSVGLTDSSQSGFWYSQAGPALPSLDGLNRFYFTVNTAFGTTYGLEPWDNAPTTGHCVDIAAGDAAGYVKLHDTGAGCGTGAGSVTSLTATSPIVATPSPITTTGVFSCPTCLTGVSTGNLSPLFTASFSATTTPVLSFTLSNAAANTVFGNFTGSSGAPSYNAVSACGDATHALKWTAGTGFGCQTISAGTTLEVQTASVDNISQVLLDFQVGTPSYGWSITPTNPSGGVEQFPVTTPYSQIATPTAPTLVVNGTPGSTQVCYKVVALEDNNGHQTAASSQTCTSTANATLSSVNSITLSAYGDTLYGAKCFAIYRTVAAGTPSTTGVIIACGGKKMIDTGLAGDSSTAPTTNNTELHPSFDSATNCNTVPDAPRGIDAPPCIPDATNSEMGQTFGAPGDANDGTWTWANQNSATATWTGGELTLTSPSRASAQNLNCLLRSVKATPYTYLAVMSVDSTWAVATNNFLEVGLYETATGKAALQGWHPGTNNNYLYSHYTSTTAVTQIVTGANTTLYAPQVYEYFKIQDDGTNLNVWTSPDGVMWTLQKTELVTAAFTTAPDRFAVCISNFVGVSTMGIDFVRQIQ